jgi:anti-sigma-K factor RskA
MCSPAQGQLIANPNDIRCDDLRPASAGTGKPTVWLGQDAPVSAGLTVDENGQSVLIITSQEAIGSFNSLGISIEPDGGSEQPTGDIVVLSEL